MEPLDFPQHEPQPELQPAAMPSLFEGPDNPDAPAAVVDDALLTKDEFYQSLFSGAFIVAGGVTSLQSLMDAPKMSTARPASDALYDIAAKFPWLQFMLRKEGMWIAQMAAIGAFGVQLMKAVQMEVAQREAAARAAQADEEREEQAA